MHSSNISQNFKDGIIRIGIVGTGFISNGLCRFLHDNKTYQISRILTRRPISSFDGDYTDQSITHNIEDLIENSDVIVECSGDAVWASEIIDLAFKNNLPVVTMNAEFQIVAGSYFCEKGILSESEGDQPANLAALDREVRMMGFEPIVYGSQKSYLNHNPDLQSMQYWADHQGQSLNNTISFTDGTKVQIESALVANGLGTHILKQGLLGKSQASTHKGAMELVEHAMRHQYPITDYVLNDQGHGEVFIVASHTDSQQAALSYYKLGKGPYYFIEKPYHLGHLEIIKSIEKIFHGGHNVFNNGSSPTISVAAVAKRKLQPGDQIEQGIGGFDVRGIAVNIAQLPDHVPIALLNKCTLKRVVEPGEILDETSVELPETLAGRAWQYTKKRALELTEK